MALALYRKYRPRTFAEVIGQEHVTEPLSQALRSGRLHHAYLFSGPRGCGKTSSARILARSLNCEQGPTPDPCGVCASCKSLMNDGTGSIDVIEIDAASHGGVDDARELREKAFFAPASSRFKIYVIDEAHMVSSAGFNALLKLVEEPPDYVKFIFATTEPEKVLGTIRSRTHHYPFRLIPPAVLRPYLQQLTEAEGVHVEPAVLPLVVRAGGGSARDSLSVLDQLIAGAGPEGVSYTRAVALLGVTDVALIDEMCDALAAGDGAAAYATIDRVAEAGHDPRRFASDLLERFRDLIILQQVPDAVTKGLIDGPADQLDAMSAQATRLGPATLSRCADIVHNGLVEMRGTTAPRLLLELITARMLLPGADDSTGALLQRLERMERRLTLTSEEGVRAPTSPSTSSAPPASPPPETAPASGAGGISAARAAAAAAARRATGDPGGAGAEGSAQSPAQSVAAAGAATVGAGVGGAATAGAGAASAGAGAAETGAADRLNAASAGVDSVREADPASRGEDSALDAPAGVDAAAGRESDGGSTSAGRAAGPGVPPSADARVAEQAQPVPQARRPELSAVLPDAPEELPAETVAVPGQLTAAAVREVWAEIIADVGRKSKKIAALASGATVRELDGQTVVLTFRFPAHAKMVSEQPHLIVDALYEALGGRWQIRCEVAGEAGGVRAGSAPQRGTPAPAQSGSAQSGSAQIGSAQAGSAQGGSAQSGSPRGDSGPSSPAQSDPGQPGVAAQDPSAIAPGGPPPGSPSQGAATQGSPAQTDSGQGGSGRGRSGVGGLAADASVANVSAGSAPAMASQTAASQAAASQTAASQAAVSRQRAAAPPPSEPEGDGDDWPEPAKPGGMTVVAEAPPADEGAGGRNGSSNGNSHPTASAVVQPSGGAVAEAAPAAGRVANGAPSSGRAAARAAAAAGASRQAGAKPTAAQSNAAQPNAAQPNAAQANADAWADGSPTEEAPYDPEYDGLPRSGPSAPAAVQAAVPAALPAAASFEGFDPGDEPLDDVIDEKTARQSSEQQAMQLLQDAFGAEKISER